MYLLNLLFWCLYSISHAIDSSNSNVLYEEFINKAFDWNTIRVKIKNEMWDTPDGITAALKMFDASTKIPSGIMAGNLYDLGNFDECYTIKYEDIYGKYCLGSLQLSNSSFEINRIQRPRFQIHPPFGMVNQGSELGFHFALCIPSNWSVKDIPGWVTYSDDSCYSQATEKGLSKGAVVTVAILSVFLALIIASTVYDTILYYKNKVTPHEFLLVFSFLTNGKKIFHPTKNPDQLLCLNGIKAISMMWVILGHEFSNFIFAPFSNLYDIVNWVKNTASMYILGSTVSVDTFFVVGGLLTVYTFLKSLENNLKFNVILYYIHRYLRLTPAFAIMVLIHLYLVTHIASGPLWSVVDANLVKVCEETWWSSLLYITNYIQKGSCVPQTWYLSVDMQLFFLSPLVLIPLQRWPKIGLFILSALVVAGCVVPFAVGFGENLGTMLTGDPLKYMRDYYIQTHTRFGPYVIGMILGYFLYKIKRNEILFQIRPISVCVLWLISLLGLIACVYAGHSLNNLTGQVDKWSDSLFLAFNRSAWAVALSGVILLCETGYGGPIHTFLSLPIFQFLTKISYSMYLAHFTVVTVRYASMKNLIKFSNVALVHAFWGDFILTLGLSLILCLAFESPIIIFEKVMVGRSSQRQGHYHRVPEI